ncbi:hypothetical protein CMUS01_13665 [Colletotrichum musicola]|uniref:Uncharacterized protein n=1 Tax=Colletotrichum musicola TaxID=2175873 RepID=A0A8H6JBA5_9PEZI|nr:hypothetical protein CMUS01_13665 [Colletotrichum musicola]
MSDETGDAGANKEGVSLTFPSSLMELGRDSDTEGKRASPVCDFSRCWLDHECGCDDPMAGEKSHSASKALHQGQGTARSLQGTRNRGSRGEGPLPRSLRSRWQAE